MPVCFRLFLFACLASLSLSAATFVKVPLVSGLVDPMKLDVAADGRVFVAERGGLIKVWNPTDKSVSEVVRFEVPTHMEDGLLGIALHPGFLTNQWLFTFRSVVAKHENHVSRFTVVNGKIDLASEKVLLKIFDEPKNANHCGGGIGFDREGNLYASTGDNTFITDLDGFAPLDERPGRELWDSQRTAGNSRDFRGKILRVTPQPDGSYKIPDGNLFPKDGSKGHPEIYIMGVRNPFRFSLDPKTGWLAWGDVGPDSLTSDPNRGPAGFDEFNLAQKAGFFGWPHFVGDNKPYRRFDFATKNSLETYDAAKPRNLSPNNTGEKELPPAQPALIWYPPSPSAKFPELGSGARSAMAGPFYRYDFERKGQGQFPKEMEGSLFIFEWERNWIKEVRLAPDGKLQTIRSFMDTTTWKRPISMEFGPEGALYILEYGTNWGSNKDGELSRVEYR